MYYHLVGPAHSRVWCRLSSPSHGSDLQLLLAVEPLGLVWPMLSGRTQSLGGCVSHAIYLICGECLVQKFTQNYQFYGCFGPF